MVNDDTYKYAFLIHTNQYAGNFERDLCAYVTGVTGDCGTGEEYAKMFCQDNGINDSDYSPFWDIIAQVPDDNGYCRPTSMWEHNGEHNTVAIFFYEKPTEKILNSMRKRAHSFIWKDLKILGFQLIKRTLTYTTVNEWKI